MAQYRISNNTRKWSPTPIVKVLKDEKGNETEKIVCILTLPKKEGEAFSEQIVNLLNTFGYENRSK